MGAKTLRRVFQMALIAGLATSPLHAQTDPFIGQWKLVKLTDQMKVTKIGTSRYAFDFGGGVETIVVDGTDQPGYAGTTLSVVPEGPNWKVVRKKGSRVLLTATWALSQDGNLLKDDFTSFGQDGSAASVNYAYERRAPGTGFAGTWVSTATVVSSAAMLQIRPYGGNGLSFAFPSQGQTINANFDGKDYPEAEAGSTSSARRLDAHAVEITRKLKNETTLTREMKLSPDLNTLTMTVHVASADEPYVYIFERQ